MKFIFYDVPVNPSSNQLYRSLPNNRRCKSKKYTEYLRSFEIWSLKNKRAIKDASDQLTPFVIDHWIKIDMYICLNQKTVYNQRGGLKKLDASNRIKACHDQFSKALDIDDKHFSVGVTEKVLTNQKEQIIVTFSLEPIKKLEDLCL